MTSEREGDRRILVGGLLLVAMLLLPSLLRGGWVLDDRELLFDNPVTGGALAWTEAFARDYFHHLGGSGAWRPVASLSLRLDRLLFGEWVVGYHLVNGALHLAVVGLAAVLGLRLGLERRVLLFGLAVFALHPLVADAVVWISGRTSPLAALFPLTGAVLLTGARRVGAGTLAAVGLGLLAGLWSKEDAVTFAPLLVALGWRRSPRAGWSVLSVVLAVLLLWCAGRAAALGAPLPRASTPVLAGVSLLGRLEVGGAALFEGLRLVPWPADYPPQYRLELLQERWSSLHPALVLGAATALLLTPWLFLAQRRGRTGSRTWAAALVALAWLPFTQLVPLGELLAPRFLYLPLLFAVPLVGGLLARWVPARIDRVALPLLAVGLAALLFERAGVYADRGAWRAELLRFAPCDAPSWNDLGIFREEGGDEDGARAAWEHAIACDPNYSKGWSNLGRHHLASGDLAQARETLERAVLAGPRNPVAHLNLGSACLKLDDLDAARASYTRAAELAPGLAPAWRGLAQARSRGGDLAGAREALEHALELDPADPITQTLRDRLREGP